MIPTLCCARMVPTLCCFKSTSAYTAPKVLGWFCAAEWFLHFAHFVMILRTMLNLQICCGHLRTMLLKSAHWLPPACRSREGVGEECGRKLKSEAAWVYPL